MVTGDEVIKDKMVWAEKSDLQVAGEVRMLMRDQLNHEAVCMAARDRIMYLSQQLEEEKKRRKKEVGFLEEKFVRIKELSGAKLGRIKKAKDLRHKEINKIAHDALVRSKELRK